MSEHMWKGQPSHYRIMAIGLVICFGLLAGIYSVVTPIWEAPDEVGHFSNVKELLTAHNLPEQEIGKLGQAHQPPLYYFLASIIASPADVNDPTSPYRANPEFKLNGDDNVNISLHHTMETFPYRGQSLAVHLARGASIILAMATVSLIVIIGWTIFPERPLIGLLAAALVAFNPQFLFINSSVNNDALLALATTGILWQALRMQQDQDRLSQWIILGIWMSVAILAKSSSFVVVVVASGFLAFTAWRSRYFKQFIQGIIVAGLIIVLLTGWWFARNLILYGDPLGWAMYRSIHTPVIRQSDLTWLEIRNFFTTQLRSFWGVFGWMNLPAPGWFYWLPITIGVASLSGYILETLSGGWRKVQRSQRNALALLAIAVLSQEIFMLWAISRFDASWYQGRYLFPVIGPISILLAFGLISLISPLTKFGRSLAISLLVLTMLGLVLFMAFNIIAPAYETIPLPKTSTWFIPNRLGVDFGDLIALKGYEIEASQDGSSMTLTLYWQAINQPDFNYSAFVHLTDSSGKLLTQNDGAPGESNGYPPLRWLPEDIVRDRRTLEIPQDEGQIFDIKVGLYNWIDGKRLRAEAGNVLPEDQVSIRLEAD